MKYSEYRFLVVSDLFRIARSKSVKALIGKLIKQPGFRYLFWLRTCAYLRDARHPKFVLYPLARVILNRLMFRYGIEIYDTTKIGPGFYIGHFGGIVVNPLTVVGRNCNISPGVVIGQANRGKRKGTAVIGDNVYIGPGAKIVGAVKIGNNVAIGANCVVTFDLPDNATVAGGKAQILSYVGSDGYVNNTDYDNDGGAIAAEKILAAP